MKSKICPFCGRPLGLIQLLRLDPHTPAGCRHCGQFIKNRTANGIIPVVVPIVLSFISLNLFGFNFYQSLAFFLLIPVLRILMAEPVKFSNQPSNRFCPKCGKEIAENLNSFESVCGRCSLPANERIKPRVLDASDRSGPAPRR
ncbi:MAG: hypothetical protein JSS81_19330 [Acidobacteria bacterium]|nr:hypothetical protein [Acidobacteriota bacterium]